MLRARRANPQKDILVNRSPLEGELSGIGSWALLPWNSSELSTVTTQVRIINKDSGDKAESVRSCSLAQSQYTSLEGPSPHSSASNLRSVDGQSFSIQAPSRTRYGISTDGSALSLVGGVSHSSAEEGDTIEDTNLHLHDGPMLRRWRRQTFKQDAWRSLHTEERKHANR
jgi:hypothetical protein